MTREVIYDYFVRKNQLWKCSWLFLLRIYRFESWIRQKYCVERTFWFLIAVSLLIREFLNNKTTLVFKYFQIIRLCIILKKNTIYKHLIVRKSLLFSYFGYIFVNFWHSHSFRRFWLFSRGTKVGDRCCHHSAVVLLQSRTKSWKSWKKKHSCWFFFYKNNV